MDIKTYIVHCKSLVNRKESLINQIRSFTNVEWYLDYDGDELTQDILEEWYTPKHWYERFLPEFYGGKIAPMRTLGKGSISLVIKHAMIYKKIAQGCDDFALVLEDDVILSPNFDHIEHRMKMAPKDWDMIFIGNCCNLRFPNAVPNQYFYKKSTPSTKCTDSFLITKKAASILTKALKQFSLPIDFELNYHLHINRMNVYWMEPPLVSQGSEFGIFESTGKPIIP